MKNYIAAAVFAATLAFAAAPAQAFTGGPAAPHDDAALHLAQYGGGYRDGGEYRREHRRGREDWRRRREADCYWEVRRVRVYEPRYARDVWRERRVRVCN